MLAIKGLGKLLLCCELSLSQYRAEENPSSRDRVTSYFHADRHSQCRFFKQFQAGGKGG